jgi:uncharacterized protein YycO
MEKKIKKSRKLVHNYTFDCGSVVDLNSYTATCTQTGNEKKFYHSYLANMIEKKFNNDFTLFENTYISREGKGILNESNKATDLEEKISKLYTKIRSLKAKRDSFVKEGV